jgi:hypothetical protein
MTTRWLVVVDRDQAAQEPRLRASFDRRMVEVVLDRRRGDRRQAREPAGSERRRTERRGAGNKSFRLDYTGKGFRIYQAVGRLALQCATCASVLETELPEFKEPPARLCLEVVHSERPNPDTLRPPQAAETSVRHTVEVQAHSATGRLLLSCCIPARPPEAYAIDLDDDADLATFPDSRHLDA